MFLNSCYFTVNSYPLKLALGCSIVGQVILNRVNANNLKYLFEHLIQSNIMLLLNVANCVIKYLRSNKAKNNRNLAKYS